MSGSSKAGSSTVNESSSSSKEGDAGKTDGGSKKDGSAGDAKGTDATMTDAGTDAAPSGPQHLLVTFTGATNTSETVVIGVTSKAVEGRIAFAGNGITDVHNNVAPFLLEQPADIVAKLDPTQPWKIDSTWNLYLTDMKDGGSFSADPSAVVVETGSKSYVLRYDRNEIAVINESTGADGGTPSSTIDISRFVQSGDSDGVVEMTAGAYVASTNRLYVVLANIDQNLETQYDGVICGQTATVIAIDTTTDTVVANLGGTGPMGSIALTYSDPTDVVYDSANDRLIVVSSGCSPQPTGGGTIAQATHRGIEQVTLGTGVDKSLLALDSITFPANFDDVPSSFSYIDSTHAVIGFDSGGDDVYNWDPTMNVLGSVIPNAPDVFTYDGHGNLLGTREETADSGTKSTKVVSVTMAGVSTTLGTNVTSLTGNFYVGSVDVWPRQ